VAADALDPNWDPARRWDGGLPALLGDVDILLPNGAEAAALSTRAAGGTAAQPTMDEARATRGERAASRPGAA
jgi:hypothetical protein